MFYIVCNSFVERTKLIDHLKQHGILAVFHYLSLHNSPFYMGKHDGRILSNSDRYSNCLLRLPLYYELTPIDVSKIINCIGAFFENEKLVQQDSVNKLNDMVI